MKADFKKWLKGKRNKIKVLHLNIYLNKINKYAEYFAEKEKKKDAIGFLKFDDLGDKNCRHLTDKDYEKLYQQYLNQNKDES